MGSEITPSTDRVCRRTPVLWCCGFLLILVSILWLPRMTWSALRHWDEAWYAEMSREMIATGDWLTIHWNDAPNFHKPPLAFWGTSVAFLTIGVSEFSARLVSSLCGLGTVLLVTFFIGRKRGVWIGLISGLILVAIPEFSRYATRGQLEGPITFWITLQLVLFWHAIERPGWHWASGAIFGLALMTKGAAGGLAPVVQLSYGLLARDLRFLKQKEWWLSLVLGGLIATPWHLHQWWVHGDIFLRDYFSRHFLQFFSDIYPEVDTPGAPATYYLDFLIRKQPEWGWLALAAWGVATVVLLRNRTDRLFVFAWCWTTVLPVALSFAWAKWNWYLVPIYPGFAILIALSVSHVKWAEGYGVRRFALAVGVLAIISGSEVLWRPQNRELEGDLRSIGPVIEREIGPTDRVLTLQVRSARKSVYAVTTRYYGRRNVQAIVGIDQLERTAESAGNVVPVLVHNDLLNDVRLHGKRSKESDPGYEVEIVATQGNVTLVRLIPGWLADQLNQAARKSAVSR
jgi:4-amino-4-deoxy-L-arabinose transferase-like glycosyltransferase